MQWWAAGYTLAFGVFMIVGGRLGDIYGRRRIFIVGIVGFTLASAACALANSPDLLIAFRVLQGGFGALLIPQGLGIIKTVFPPSEMGGAFAAFGPGDGPGRGRRAGARGLAGLRRPARHRLADDLPRQRAAGRARACSARCAFFPESRSPEKLRLDPLGVVLISAASLALIYPLVQGRELGWPIWTFALMAAGVALLGAFAVVERRGTARR